MLLKYTAVTPSSETPQVITLGILTQTLYEVWYASQIGLILTPTLYEVWHATQVGLTVCTISLFGEYFTLFEINS